MYRINAVILFFNEAKYAAIALAKARLFNDVKKQNNKSKCIGYFFTSP